MYSPYGYKQHKWRCFLPTKVGLIWTSDVLMLPWDFNNRSLAAQKRHGQNTRAQLEMQMRFWSSYLWLDPRIYHFTLGCFIIAFSMSDRLNTSKISKRSIFLLKCAEKFTASHMERSGCLKSSTLFLQDPLVEGTRYAANSLISVDILDPHVSAVQQPLASSVDPVWQFPRGWQWSVVFLLQ